MLEQLQTSLTTNPLIWVIFGIFLFVNNYSKVQPMLKSIFGNIWPHIEIPEASKENPHDLVQRLIILTADNPEANDLARQLGKALYEASQE